MNTTGRNSAAAGWESLAAVTRPGERIQLRQAAQHLGISVRSVYNYTWRSPKVRLPDTFRVVRVGRDTYLERTER